MHKQAKYQRTNVYLRVFTRTNVCTDNLVVMRVSLSTRKCTCKYKHLYTSVGKEKRNKCEMRVNELYVNGSTKFSYPPSPPPNTHTHSSFQTDS